MKNSGIDHYSRSTIGSSSRLVDVLIDRAFDLRASDLHIDVSRHVIRIRMRVDGILSEDATGDISLMPEIIGRIKILSGLRADTHDRSQDGRFFRQHTEGRVDVRVSVAPTYYGENAVLRLLYEHDNHVSTLEHLGYTGEQQSMIFSALKRGQGLVIVAGPTGSGKTRTLYSCLRHIASGQRSVISLEDPVEYPIEDVRQINVKTEAGYGFSDALRGVLRQDPDIIMLGEMRDKETASIAVQIALTGHLIITSLHAEDAVHVIPRLIDMGIEPYLLSATLHLVIGQRLIRKSSSEGFSGRTGVFEVLHISESLRSLIIKRPLAKDVLKHAEKQGYMTMLEHALHKVEEGITTIDEVKRVFHE